MVNVRSFILGDYPIRGFLAWAEGDREALFIDPGGWDDAISVELDLLGLTVGAIVLTHGHADHTGGMAAMAAAVQAPTCAHAGDLDLLPIAPDRLLQEGDCVRCGSLSWQVLHVPGHTPGSVAYAAEQVVFTGDTLFAGSIGGTVSLARYEQERASIRTWLFPLGDATRLYPAHGPATTIGAERRFNPFLR